MSQNRTKQLRELGRQYEEGLTALKKELKTRVDKFDFMRNAEQYAFFMGLVKAYNFMATDKLEEIPRPDFWADDEKKSDIEIIKPKIIL